MLALGIVLVIVGFMSLPRQGIGGPATHRNVAMGLQGVHSVGDSAREPPAWRSLVARALLSFSSIGAGVVLIAIGS